MRSLRRFGRVGTEIALAVAGLFLGVAVTIVLNFLGLLPSDGPFGRATGFIAGPLITGTGAVFYSWAARAMDVAAEERAETAPASGSVPRALAWAALGIAAALTGSYLLGELMTRLDFPVAEQTSIVAITSAGKRGEATLELATLCITAVLLAPLAEEWLFRGLLFRRTLARGGAPVAFIVSAIAFAAIHDNVAGFVIYVWLGLVFAETLRRTGRLWTAVLVHMGNNAFALTLLLAE